LTYPAREVGKFFFILHRFGVGNHCCDAQSAARFGVLAQQLEQFNRRVVVGLARLRDEVERNDDLGASRGERSTEFVQQQVRDDAGEPRARTEHDEVCLAHRIDRGRARRCAGGQQSHRTHPSRRGRDR
jgi:hypothetical protein